jgi:hypothetical protein
VDRSDHDVESSEAGVREIQRAIREDVHFHAAKEVDASAQPPSNGISFHCLERSRGPRPPTTAAARLWSVMATYS